MTLAKRKAEPIRILQKQERVGGKIVGGVVRLQIGTLVVLALALGTGLHAAAQTQSIGKAVGVENTVWGSVSGDQKRIILGNDVYENERVQTNESSNAHLNFLDDTKLSVGPESNIVLDRFVYDPNGGAGKVVLQLGRGSFRFITGNQDKSSYQIKTPVATIGVRGTIFSVLDSDQCSLIVLEEGSISLTFPNGKVVVLDKTGEGVQACTDGRLIGPQIWAVSLPDPFGLDHNPPDSFPPVSEIPDQDSRGDLQGWDTLPSCVNPSCN